MKRFPIVKHSILWLVLSAIIAAGAAVIFFTNLNLSIQFTGGMEISVDGELDAPKVEQEVKALLEENGYENPSVKVGEKDGYDNILLQIPVDNQEKVTQLGTEIQEYLIDNGFIKDANGVLEQAIIGASIGDYVKNSTIRALGLGFLFIAVYIAFSFMAVRDFISPTIL